MFASEARSWYAIRVKSNREKITAEALKGKEYEVLLPCYKECRRRGSSARTVELPLFPGYIFCRLDAQDRLPVLMVSGVVHIVGSGRTPEPIDPAEMEGVFALLRSELPLSPAAYPPIGERVQIQKGPLRGVDGLVIAHKNSKKLVVSVSLLQRSMAVDVDYNWIRPQRDFSAF
jgi:transcription antitermination factor NusG